MTNYFQDFRKVGPNHLTLLQVNPDCAAQLDSRERDYGWLYIKHPDGQWVTSRKLEGLDLEIAHEQDANGHVLQGTKVRMG